MSIYGFLAFCLAYALAVASPGPGVAAVLAHTLGNGMRGTPALIAGFLVGDIVWFVVAAAGMAALAQVAHTAFVVVKYAGIAYLLYLAFRLWTAPAQPVPVTRTDGVRSHVRLFLASLTLTVGNPKTMLFFVALLPAVVPLQTFGVVEYSLSTAVIVVILPVILGAYAIAGSYARSLFRRPFSIHLLNRSAATAMTGAAVIALRD